MGEVTAAAEPFTVALGDERASKTTRYPYYTVQWRGPADRAEHIGNFHTMDRAEHKRRRLNAVVAAAVAAERERCARIVESYDNTEPDRAIAAAAAEIRGGK